MKNVNSKALSIAMGTTLVASMGLVSAVPFSLYKSKYSSQNTILSMAELP